MNRLIYILILPLLSWNLLSGQNNTISGLVTYKNASSSIIKDSTWILLTRNDTLITTDTVDINGGYSFTSLPAGTYKLKAASIKKWGGVNAVDALKITTHYIGLHPLTGLNLLVGDVNQSGGTPGSVDALAVVRRWAGQIISFAPNPDWYSLKYTITLTAGDSIIQDIQVLCAGDVNGDYIPY